MNRKLWLSLFLIAFAELALAAETPISFLKSKQQHVGVPEAAIAKQIQAHFATADFREIRAQVIFRKDDKPDHMLVYLHSKHLHRVDYANVKLDAQYQFLEVQNDYVLQAMDIAEQPGMGASGAKCPDETIEFISFCPNQDDLELQITKDVATYARAHNLKTIELLVKDATRDNYLNYMACPKLRGNFYDGDANTSVITTNDGTLSYTEFKTTLNQQFKFNVTNIWLACQAYNDPMLSAVIKSAQSKKYAAGKNDLEVGPSDRAAACGMEAAIDGKAMSAAFQECINKFDNTSDIWGFGGDGSDFF